MRKVTVLVLVLVALFGIIGTAAAANGGRRFTTTLTGAAEVPGPGDPDGSGTAVLRLNPGQEEVCWEIQVSNITLPATGAHIHRGTATQFGGIVVHLTAPDESGTSSGCTFATRELILEIIQNPENFYVNVHTLPLYGAGAVRGQLGK